MAGVLVSRPGVSAVSSSGFSGPLLAERAARGLPFIAEVKNTLAKRIAVFPWTANRTVGVDGRSTSFSLAWTRLSQMRYRLYD